MEKSIIFLIMIQWVVIQESLSEDPKNNQINQVNPDGSFQFGSVESGQKYYYL